MMRIYSGLFCALAVAAAYACSSSDHGGHPTADAAHHVPSCGDGVCDANEINTCPQDCGMGVGACNHDGICNNGETNTSCPDDCGGGGSGSGSGSGGGSGALNCADSNTVLACVACLALNTCTPPINAADCTTCLGGGLGSGLGSGSGGPCNFDGVCDAGAGETHASCPTDCP